MRLAVLAAAMTTAACTSTATQTTLRSAEADADVRAAATKAARTEAPSLERSPESASPDDRPPALAPAEEAKLAQSIDLPSLEAAVIARQPSLVAASHRVRALIERARAEGKLPPPEVMADVWQVPFTKPYAFDRAAMIMFSIRQQFPAAGSLDRMAESMAQEAHAEAAKAAVEARALVRETDRAFVAYAEASARHGAHDAHRTIVDQMAAAARARYSTGGPLGDVTRSQLELARTEAEVAREHGMVSEARARLNGLLSRAVDAPLGAAAWADPRTVAIAPEQAAALAAAGNPEVAMADRMEKSARAAAEAAERMASVPMFTAGVSVSMPTNDMPAGYGLSFGMSLPWAWGAASGRQRSAEQKALAERAAAQGARLRVRTDAAMALASVRAAERRYLVLRDTAVPAAHRALDAARAGYAAGGTDLLMWLDAARAALEIEVDLATAHGDLDRALADLDWAAGAHVPRAPLPASKDQRHAP
ncbi:Heavy metal RND efflux outer membrane protein, CzcC family protein [Minicystis rosea]|nr:Heavy metal RND efflux outer membrane protein, CzcC family protein [Minicystis rosea]